MGFEKEASSSSYALPAVNAGDGSGSPLLSSCPKAQQQQLSSQPKTFANVFIAIVGAGVLGLPYTFMRTGWVAGVVMLLVVGGLTYHCMMLLVLTRRRLESEAGGKSARVSSFGDLGFAVSGPVGRAAVDVMIILSQAGFCVGYLIFISNTLAHLYDFRPLPLMGAKSTYIWALFPFQLGLNSIKTLTHLAPLSIFADVVDMGAMGVVLGEDVAVFLHRPLSFQPFNGLSVVLYGLGVAVFAFEGIGVVLPLECEAADRDKFGWTLGVSMALISVIYALFGAFGYFAFGDDTRDIITTNLGPGVVTLLVQLGLCVNLFFTFPLMMHPVYEVVERWFCGKSYCLWLRWLLVVGINLVAMLVPNFADFLSLIGSSVCCLLGFVLPALFHIKTFGPEMSWAAAAVDIAIVVIGIVFAVSGTWTSLQQIFFAEKV